MSRPARSRILIVDDEEAILETMTFTFESEYEVHTAAHGERALEILDEQAPVAAIITDQRMPGMSGVELLARVFERHPSTVRIVLTGFADMEAVVKAINDGHAYAYLAKPWEPDELKQVVRRAVEHHRLEQENLHLLEARERDTGFLEAVMDRLDVGALAIDARGEVRAANRLARDYLGLQSDPHGRELRAVLEEGGLEQLGTAAMRLAADPDSHTEELDAPVGSRSLRLRMGVQTLLDRQGAEIGRVLFLREISHEPLRRRVDELIAEVAGMDGALRERIEKSAGELRALAEPVRARRTESPGLAELHERISRTLTALESWLAVDDALAREPYPDAQLLLDRMRIATARWPLPAQVPARVRELAQRVESYYESGENRARRVL